MLKSNRATSPAQQHITNAVHTHTHPFIVNIIAAKQVVVANVANRPTVDGMVVAAVGGAAVL